MFVTASTFSHLFREFECCVYMHALVCTFIIWRVLCATVYLVWLEDSLSILSFYHVVVSGD